MKLGCIGDDFTGSSDLANTLSKAGMRVTQYCGLPQGSAGDAVEAGVISLKTRTVPPQEAIRQSLEALSWLKAQGCSQFLFKYCSTFDSTDQGNIGPVAEALRQSLGDGPAIFCPSFPATGRTVYQGHLFVNDILLSDSSMKDHPLTPMRDADLRRVLARQVKSGVGHIPIQTVEQGTDAIRRAIAHEAENGRPLIIVDAILETQLVRIGHAAAGLKLVTGGSGIAMGLPDNFSGLAGKRASALTRLPEGAKVVCIAGSVSSATRRQVKAHISAGLPAIAISPSDVVEDRITADQLSDWLLAQSALPLVYSSAEPDVVAEAQQRFGKETVAQAIEKLFAQTAILARRKGVSVIISAGGETSGAIVSGLGLEALEIGPEIDPGVPALVAGRSGLRLALKSGNFGADDFFAKAAAILRGTDDE